MYPTEQQLGEQFRRIFDTRPAVFVRSPGRVNLIGEHTDYNDGLVFPAALDLGTVVAARQRDDGILRTVARRLAAEDVVPIDNLQAQTGPEWTRFVRGVAAILGASGYTIPGANLLIDGDLPLGAGLSSSASLELGVAVTLMTLAGYAIDRTALARLGQRVEHEIIGVQSGIMDQLAIAYGMSGHLLLIDCRTLDIQPVPLPAQVKILILDSAVPRTLAGSAYNQRRAECTSALRKLQVVQPDLRALRDVTLDLLTAEAGRLDLVERQRVLHVVSENQRVLDSVAALRTGDVAQVGQLMHASHISLRDDYAVSSADLDTLVTLAMETPGILGARLTGAGFGGCVVALVETQHATAAAATITERYQQANQRAGAACICIPDDGVSAH